jgi:hypothetical protein
MSVLDNMKGKEVSPKVAVACILGLVAVSAVGIFLVKKAVSGPVEAVESPKVHLLQSSTEDGKVAPPVKNGKKDAAPAQDACAVIIARNIFSPIAGLTVSSAPAGNAAAKPAVAVTSLPPMPVTGIQSLPGMSFGGRFGFGMGRGGGRNVAFTGIVDTPEGTMALIENPATSETRFVAVGDKVFGMDVLEIGPHSVLLETSDGSTVRLAIGENKPDAAPKASTPTAAAATTGQQPADQAQSGAQQAPGSSTGQTRRWNRGGNPGQAAPTVPSP